MRTADADERLLAAAEGVRQARAAAKDARAARGLVLADLAKAEAGVADADRWVDSAERCLMAMVEGLPVIAPTANRTEADPESL